MVVEMLVTTSHIRSGYSNGVDVGSTMFSAVDCSYSNSGTDFSCGDSDTDHGGGGGARFSGIYYSYGNDGSNDGGEGKTDVMA